MAAGQGGEGAEGLLPAQVAVQERLAKAQKEGNLDELRKTLLEAREIPGSDIAKIDETLAELDQAKAAREADSDKVAQAETWKKQGNEKLKENTRAKVRDAVDCYTAGIEVGCQSGTMLCQLHNNRAHARMLLKQFVEAVDDCKKAIMYDPSSVKAYWRAAKASMAIELFRNAVDFCREGLALDPGNADLQKAQELSIEKLEAQQRSRGKMREFNADEAMELQEKVSSLNEQLGQVSATFQAKQREQQRTKLTKSVLDETPKEVKCYTPLGRSFMVADRNEVDKDLADILSSIDEELPRLAGRRDDIERRKNEAEDELRMMVQAFKRSQSSSG